MTTNSARIMYCLAENLTSYLSNMKHCDIRWVEINIDVVDMRTYRKLKSSNVVEHSETVENKGRN